MSSGGDPPVHRMSPDHGGVTDWSHLRRIFVATDGSSSSSDAVALAVGIAAHHHAELIVGHVVPTLDYVFPIAVEDIGVALPHVPTPLDHQVLVAAEAVAADHDVEVTKVLLAGDAADEIVTYGDAHDVDLIVVGSHGHGVIASAVVGSVSLHVLRTSRRPVLVVRGPHVPADPGRSTATATPHEVAAQPTASVEATPS
jgi:nucleotide-binding universal stress UspA family protein